MRAKRPIANPTSNAARCAGLAVSAAALVPASAWAQPNAWLAEPAAQPEVGRPLVLRAGLQWQHDSNVLRTSGSPFSDRIGVYTAGLTLDQTYSRQRVEIDAQIDAYRYQSTSSLDFEALNYRAAWHWGLGPDWSGRLAAERRQWVDRLGDSAVTSGLVRRTEASGLLELQYQLAASWQALGGLFERRQKNTDPFGQEPDSTVRGGELGFLYKLASDNNLSYRFRQGQGEYSAAPVLADPGDFTEREHVLDLNWTGSGRLRVQGQLAYLDRSHDLRPQRDWSGWTARLGAQWDLTGKTVLGAGLVRELGAYQTTQASYFEGYRLYLAPQWQAAPKTLLRLRLEDGQRNYKGAPAGVVAPARRDRLQAVALELQWQALRTLRLGLSAQRDERRSNQAGADYRAHRVSASAQAAF